MNLSSLQPKTLRKDKKRVGRGGKRGTFSGGGSKGQKSRAGASIRAGFRGGDNRIWQLFPKQRGASKKPGRAGNDSPHRKHRYYMLRHEKPAVVNIKDFNNFNDGEIINPKLLFNKGIVSRHTKTVKILGDGELDRKLVFDGFSLSKSARDKIMKAGGTIH